MRRIVILALVVASIAGHAGAALPPVFGSSPPVVSIQAERTDDPFMFDVTVWATDQDGAIRSLRVCLESDCASAEDQDLDPVQTVLTDVAACTDGDETSLTETLRAPGFGTFWIEAWATGGGCPGIGSDETATTRIRVGVAPPLDPIPCTGNGIRGSSDTGITPASVRIAAVTPISGPEPTRTHLGLLAAAEAVNTAGGVCGRTLQVVSVDDGFDAPRGRQFIENLEADSFALVGMTSWPGLAAAIDDGFIDATGFPVIGSPGESPAEFTSQNVFPAGARRESAVGEAVRAAYGRGSRSFAIVWDDIAGTGATSAAAAVIATLPGATLKGERRVSLSEPSFESVAHDLRLQCGGSQCDATLLMVTSINQIKWHQALSRLGEQTDEITGPRGLSEFVARNCRPACAGTRAWTAFESPIPPAGAAAAAYEAHLIAAAPTADILDPFTEQAYLSVLLAAHALGRAGPNPTRASVAAILNSQSFDLGLTAGPLSWSSGRNANAHVRSYVVETDGSWSQGDAWRP